MTRGLRYMATDPGLANIGVNWGYITPKGLVDLVGFQYLKTEKSSAKRNFRDKSDDMRRLLQLQREFGELVDAWDPQVSGFEECPSISVNAKTTRQCALGWGLCLSLAATRSGSLIYEFPIAEVKICLTGKKKASKAEMIAAAEAEHELFKLSKLPKSKKEHIADSIGVAKLLSRDSAVVMLAKTLEGLQ